MKSQSCPTHCDPVDYTIHGILQARILEWVAFPFSPGDLPKSGMEPRFPTLQADSLPAESQGKPKNTGGGSLSLLQQTFPIQELNQDLLHCKWILYQLNYQGNPSMITVFLSFFFLITVFLKKKKKTHFFSIFSIVFSFKYKEISFAN